MVIDMKRAGAVALDCALSTVGFGSGCGEDRGAAATDPPASDADAATLGDSAPADGAPGDSATGDASDANDGGLRDPNADGPFAYGERDATAVVAATGDSVAIHVA